MSQLIKHVLARKDLSYFFKIALDHAPERDEIDALESRIKTAMESLGVPAERVGVVAYKSATPPEANTPQATEGIRFHSELSFLLCVLVRTEEGGYTEDPDEVAERAVRGFLAYSGIPSQNVAAVVLEDAYLEVEMGRKYDPNRRAGVIG